MIIFYYLIRETVLATIAISGVLVSVFSVHIFIRYLSEAAVGKYPAVFVLQLILLEIPNLICLLLPLSFYLAILITYGRMYNDNEMTIISGSGVSKYRILGFTLALGCLIGIVVAILSLWICPDFLAKRERLRFEARSAALVEMLMPGHFQTILGSEKVIYVNGISPDRKEARKVFLTQKNKSALNQSTLSWDILVAQKAYITSTKDNNEQYVVLDKGMRYIGEPGKQNFQVIQFEKYGVRIPDPPHKMSQHPRAQPTKLLLKALGTKSFDAIAELQWRFSLPISVLVLTFLAVPLSELKPRQGKYVKILPAVALYITYANFLFINREWVKTNMISPELGMWWVHSCILIFGLISFCYPSIKKKLQRRVN